MSDRLSVRARFERFPATLKGAFILRGEDRDPHQVVFRDARIASLVGERSRSLGMAGLTIDVAPHQDVFVPFEVSVSDLEPGWYDLVCDLEIDGTGETHSGGRRFSVAWPRATTRRGQVRVGREVRVGEAAVRVEHVDCAGDSIKLAFVVTPPQPVSVALSASADRLEVIETEQDETTGRGRVVAYPLLRTHDVLTVAFRAGRGTPATLDVPLP